MWPWSSRTDKPELKKSEDATTTPSPVLWKKTEDIAPPRVDPPDSVKSLLSQFDVSLAKLEATLEPYPRLAIAAVAFGLGGLAVTTLATTHGHHFTRLRNSDWVTPLWFTGKRQWIKGKVTRVGDGDNFRLFHTPALGGHRWPLRYKRIPKSPGSNETLHIRLAGVDAPELPHFGKPGQAYGREALEWLMGTIEGKTVYCQLIKGDQYKRVIANVYLPYLLVPTFISPGRNISLEMLKAGWATVYSQAGAEYGSVGIEAYRTMEEQAKKARRGMYAKGVLIETPAEYKRRHGQSSPDLEKGVDTVTPVPSQKPGLLSRFMEKIKRT